MIKDTAGRAQASLRTGSKSPVQGDDGLSPELCQAGSTHQIPTAAARASLLWAALPQGQSPQHSQERCLPRGTWSQAFPWPRGMPQRASCLESFKDTFIFASFFRMGKTLASWQVLDASGYSHEPCLLVGQGQRWEQLLFCAEYPHFQRSVLF